MRRFMEELVERIARGNVTEVKVLLTSVAAALAVYQLVLIAVGYGKLRPRFLGAGPAAKAHRASGDTIAVLALKVVVIRCSSSSKNSARSAKSVARSSRRRRRV